MELNLSGIKEIDLTKPTKPVLDIPELDLKGVDEILSKGHKSPSDRITFQPTDSDWSLARLGSIEDFFLKEFSKPLPVSTIGQGNIHNKWSYDHRASADISLNPNSVEGRRLVSYLKGNNIPFLAFTKKIPGIATGPHIHIGRPSHKISGNIETGTTLDDQDIELDLTGLDEILSTDKNIQTITSPELDITGVGNVQAPFDLTGALDPKKIDFQGATERVPGILDWATRYNKPVVTGQNPNEMGPIVKTVIDNPKNEKPSVKQLTDAWLNAWNSEYKELNDRFREETGGLNIALVDSRKNYRFLKDNKLEISSRPTRGVQALFEAYKHGGLREFNATNMLINHQLLDAYNEQVTIKENIKKYEKEHPYLSAIESGVQGTAQSITHLSTNIKYLGKAVATGNYYGYDSQEYIDLINTERGEQEIIAELGETIYRPPSFTGKVIAGAAQGLTSLPIYVAAGRVTPFALPLMTYVENLHRGNREAALAALPMAILVGSGKGLGQFTDINPAGSSAPFRRVAANTGKFTKDDLSILQDSIVKGESVSITQLTPFERQLIHRGANAISLQFPTDGQTWQDVAANVVVGLGFPVGKSPGKVELASYVPKIIPKVPLPIGEAKIEVPVTKFAGPILEQTSGINSTDPLASTLEKGFIAAGQGQTLHLDLDTANLNLLELKRSLEEHTYRREGDDLKTVLQKQQAIKNAIAVLEQAIPDSTKEFFAQNEKVIRESLRTNYEARVGKENLIKRREESIKPNDVKILEPENPVVNTGKESTGEIFSGKAGDSNVFTSQEKAHQILNDFFKITTQGTLKSSLVPYGDVLASKIQDLSYLGAFYVEDFYRRGVVPTVDLVLNRIRGSLGDFGRYISDDQAKDIFNRGLDYYNSNVADPFFSKLKQDAAEKLPNILLKKNINEVRKVLMHSANFHEFTWTTGLEDLLTQVENGRKVTKQELVDFINTNQVRVETIELDSNRSVDEQTQKDKIFGKESSRETYFGRKDYRTDDIGVTRYYELPEGSNYREKLLISNVAGMEDLNLYQSGHWKPANTFAHVRENDRVTTTGEKVSYVEELQSDWDAEIKRRGIKPPVEELYDSAKNNIEEISIQSVDENDNPIMIKNYRVRNFNVSSRTKEGAIRTYISMMREGKIESMPFIGNDWKELGLKRSLRDAAIAKDESGNYKYDGIGWSTAKVQQERYGRIIPVREFQWVREFEDFYSFKIKDENTSDWYSPRELHGIKLEQLAKLTDESIVDEIKKQERIIRNKGEDYSKHTLSEPIIVNLKADRYRDYDTTYKNIITKVGKQFGAKYSEKEVPVGTNTIAADTGVGLSTIDVPQTEKIHYLEITPSMRQSLEKEGLPLFGTTKQGPLVVDEIGIRNVITTREGFNQHRDLLIKSLQEVSNKGDGTVLNSGLNPDALVDQFKLLYRGIQDFNEFTQAVVARFGEQVRPFLQDLWMQVKDIARAFHEDERGFLNLQFRRMRTDAEKRYKASKKKTAYYDNYSIHRGIMLAQLDPQAGIVYDVMRLGQRDKNGFEYNVLQDLRSANKSAKLGGDQSVAENIFMGNENQRLFTNAELAAGDPAIGRPALNPDQIKAYRETYKAEHRNLDKRLQHVLFGYRQRADRLNARLGSVAAGSASHTNILGQLLDIADAMKKVTDHYQHLKDTGYISLRRKGPIAAFVQDPAFPVGDRRGEVYRQFQTVREAGIWVAEQEKLLKANPTQSNIYDVNIPQRLRAATAKLTPAQFEELIDSSGVNVRSPEVEKLRDEIYSRFPSKGYELKRDYVRGYDRSWQFVMESVADQTESYANSFYSHVAGEHAIQALEATGLSATNNDLHQVLQKFIDHEISSPERNKSSKFFTGVRKGVYLFQLGFDVNQLYLNAIAQPITQTYSYFARVSHAGKTLGPLKTEKYWIDAWQLAGNVAKKAATGKGNVPTDFENIRNQLIAEGVITPEFNKSLLESEVEKAVSTKLKPRNAFREVEHWAGVFMRAGEKTTRTHVAAEAYLVGKNEFGLSGNDLTNFMVRAIDATQTNPSRAEAPLLIRGTQNQGEIRKLLYQFNAFNHMWIENLALNVKSDFQNRGISATSRHLIPLAIMGGIAGLPLAGVVGGLYTLITNKDPKDEFHKYVGNFPLLERLALYGVTGNATISGKVVPTVPFTESIKIEDTATDTLKETLSTSAIPALSTAAQITRGFDDLIAEDYLRGVGGLLPIKPLRNIATSIRYKQEGVKTRKGTTIIPKSKVTNSQLFFQGLGIPPSPVTEYYSKKNTERRTKTIKKIRKVLT